MRAARILACLIVSLFLRAGDPYAQEIGGNETRKTNQTVKVDGVDEPVYYVGGEVKPPQIVSAPKPQSGTPNAQGTVVVSMIVTSKGEITNIKVIKGVNATVDAKAIETARQYKFKPSTKDGKPVSVQIAIEVDLYP